MMTMMLMMKMTNLIMKLQEERSEPYIRCCLVTLRSALLITVLCWPVAGGAIELHRLAVEDPAQLERRKEEITVGIINATCSADDGEYREVSQAPLPKSPPGHVTVSRLLLQSLGLGAPAAEQGCRSKQGDEIVRWSRDDPPLVGSSIRLHGGLQEPPCKRGQAGY